MCVRILGVPLKKWVVKTRQNFGAISDNFAIGLELDLAASVTRAAIRSLCLRVYIGLHFLTDYDEMQVKHQ